LGIKISKVRNFSRSAFKELTYASNEVVEGVISGEIKPKVKDIREEEQKTQEAEAERNQARIAEAKASRRTSAQQTTLPVRANVTR